MSNNGLWASMRKERCQEDLRNCTHDQSMMDHRTKGLCLANSWSSLYVVNTNVRPLSMAAQTARVRD